MDARRSRRKKDDARKAWYAYYRQVRFARWLGFVEHGTDFSRSYRSTSLVKPSMSRLTLSS